MLVILFICLLFELTFAGKVDIKASYVLYNSGFSAVDINCYVKENDTKSCWHLTIKRQVPSSNDSQERIISVASWSPDNVNFWSRLDKRVKLSNEWKIKSTSKVNAGVNIYPFTVNDFGLYICEMNSLDNYGRCTSHTDTVRLVESGGVKVNLKLIHDTEYGSTTFSFKCSVKGLRPEYIRLSRNVQKSLRYPSKYVANLNASIPESSHVSPDLRLRLKDRKFDLESDSEAYFEVTFTDFSVDDHGLYICEVSGWDKDGLYIFDSDETRVVESGGKLSGIIEEDAVSMVTFVAERITGAPERSVGKINLKVSKDPTDKKNYANVIFNCLVEEYDTDSAWSVTLKRQIPSSDDYPEKIIFAASWLPDDVNFWTTFNDRVVNGLWEIQPTSNASLSATISSFNDDDLGLYICEISGLDKNGRCITQNTAVRIVESGGESSHVFGKPEEVTFVVGNIPAPDTSYYLGPSFAVKVDLKLINDSDDDGYSTLFFKCSVEGIRPEYIKLSRNLQESTEHPLKYIADLDTNRPESPYISSEFDGRVTPGKFDLKSDFATYFEVIFWDFNVDDLGLYFCQTYGLGKNGMDYYMTGEKIIGKIRGSKYSQVIDEETALHLGEMKNKMTLTVRETTVVPYQATFAVRKPTAMSQNNVDNEIVKVDLKFTYDSKDGGSTTFSFKCTAKDIFISYIILSRKLESPPETHEIARLDRMYQERPFINDKFYARVTPGEIKLKSSTEGYFEVIFRDFRAYDLGIYTCEVHGSIDKKYRSYFATASVVEDLTSPPWPDFDAVTDFDYDA